ncbi:unnamed protein product [Darwinula stevensoni]|uniref:Zeta-sarcoglycan n=1 Tax=Darwinula stevensoni TaxID=69355 RepID=A0A7R8WZ04_9CRUS|nr:unnamed protein product [Darwinula stevensoni]CAG0879657.1 unnamed protein product [Darwinula stevensoni]
MVELEGRREKDNFLLQQIIQFSLAIPTSCRQNGQLTSTRTTKKKEMVFKSPYQHYMKLLKSPDEVLGGPSTSNVTIPLVPCFRVVDLVFFPGVPVYFPGGPKCEKCETGMRGLMGDLRQREVDEWLGVGDSSSETQLGSSARIGIYGWRKRFLYLLLILLLVMIITNLSLTLWILKVMDFSVEGMGRLRIISEGLRLDGEAYILDRLIMSHMRSRRGQAITLEASRNFTIRTRKDTQIANTLFLGENRLDCEASSFRIVDPLGRELFSATRKEVHVGASTLRVSGPGGAEFDAVQTPLVRAEASHELRLESPTRSITMEAPESIGIESWAGDIYASCLTNIRLQSRRGAIYLNSGKVRLPDVPIANVTSSPRQNVLVYQMCACGNGQIFLVPPTRQCHADPTVCF